MYIPELSSYYDSFQIQYLVVHEPQDISISTPFQGFTIGILRSADAFDVISKLPRDVLELFMDQPDIAAHRVIRGGYYVQPMEVPVVEPWLRHLKRPFCCVWSTTPDVAIALRPVLEHCPSPVLHVTPEEIGFGVHESEFSRETLRSYVAEVAAHWERTGIYSSSAVQLRARLERGDAPEEVPLSLVSQPHYLTRPNEAALLASGYTLPAAAAEPLVGTDNTPYLTALKASVEAVVAERRHALAKVPEPVSELVPCDLILTVPSSFKHVSDVRNMVPTDVPDRLRKPLQELVRQIDRRETYNFLLRPEGPMHRALESAEGQMLLTINRLEMHAYTSAVAIRASSNLVPVIRLPPAVNNVRQHVIALANAARSSKAPQNRMRKLSEVAQRLSAKLVESVPDWVLEHLRGRTAVKLIADAPLEWLPLDGLPLTLQTDVSRIATTPGSLFVQQAIGMREIVLGPESLDEVLILRAFKPDDPLRNVLTQCTTQMAEAYGEGRPRLRFVDIRTSGELIEALNSFDGALAVYDGHGTHSKDTDIGALALPNEQVNTWELRGKARIPPIVLLSACDTHPVDASHATTANGFLAAGAHTVVGTQLPVQGIESAIFVARLLLRINQYMDVLLNRGHQSMRWSELMPGLQRRQYVSEALRAVDGNHGIRLRTNHYMEIMFDVGMAIDTGDRQWHELLVKKISEAAAISEDRVRTALRREAYVTDALLHVQFGNPDQVIIARPPAH